MSRFKLKKRSKGAGSPVELNVTPMIDMFSVLIAFLLMVAVFTAVGYHRVEVPFFSSAPPKTQEELDKDPPWDVSLTVDLDKFVLAIGHGNKSEGTKKETYNLDDAGLDQMQGVLYDLRKENFEKFDKVTVMLEYDVPYETLVKVLDWLRILKNNREPIPLPVGYELPSGVDESFLIPKIVLGNATMMP